jgi:hypothetical protein
MVFAERDCEIFPSIQSDLSLANAPYRVDFDAKKFAQSLRANGVNDEAINSLTVELARRPDDKIGTSMRTSGEYLRRTHSKDIW